MSSSNDVIELLSDDDERADAPVQPQPHRRRQDQELQSEVAIGGDGILDVGICKSGAANTDAGGNRGANHNTASGNDFGEVVILSDNDGGDDDTKQRRSADDDDSNHMPTSKVVENPYKKAANGNVSNATTIENPYAKKRKVPEALQKPKARTQKCKAQFKYLNERELQTGLVFGEDVDHIQHDTSYNRAFVAKRASAKSSNNGTSSDDDNASDVPVTAESYAKQQLATRVAHQLPPILYHDLDFVAGRPETIDGIHKTNTSKKKADDKPVTAEEDSLSFAPPKCRCRPPQPCKLAYSTKEGPSQGMPYHTCSKCKYFGWAFTSHMLHWYRFGAHNGHVMVNPSRGYNAEDLLQGKVGDCWFLSALAVVAERDDLIGRLVGGLSRKTQQTDSYGVVEVTLFVDGYWKKLVLDDFLPCMMSLQNEKKEEDEIQLVMKQSLVEVGINTESHWMINNDNNTNRRRTSSKFDRLSLADECHTTLTEVHEFLHRDRFNKDPAYRATHRSSSLSVGSSSILNRRVTTSDLAYSKAKQNQLWVPFLEKAYAKMHGSYKAISGGHVEEAFLDLTGAPTLVYNFDHHDFNARSFWSDLMQFRSKRLPMGCATSSSQEGIIGMHAYSILDVREVKDVSAEFFFDKISAGTLGNVSGFTELDNVVRLLRIRNPHGRGEWQGEFSDKSDVWTRLLAHKKNGDSTAFVGEKELAVCDLTKSQSPDLKRTMVNDGTFWIGYDDFLMGFSNVDVVLAFEGNHAKSFGANFPNKTSPHRCNRAFELSVVGRQPGDEGASDNVEVYIMGIQKTRRGAAHGRADRKKSYKQCDLGILIAETSSDEQDEDIELDAVDGRFFGLARNGHIRLVLDRLHPDAKMIVMPISFGHPVATDEELSFVVRFISDCPLIVRELQKCPNMNVAMQKYCFGRMISTLGTAGTSRYRGMQCAKSVLMSCKRGYSFLFKIFRVDCLASGGGTVLLYLVVNDACFSKLDAEEQDKAISFSIEVNCRGMNCRTANGLEKHEVIAKGKKFEAAWRRFNLQFTSESKSRLLASVVQSGQDHQVGSIKSSWRYNNNNNAAASSSNKTLGNYFETKPSGTKRRNDQYGDYVAFGIYASVDVPLSLVPSEHQQRVEDELAIALQKSREDYIGCGDSKETTHINLCDDPNTSMTDGDLDAAILASIKDNNRESGGGRNGNAHQSSFDDDIDKAIYMSLQHK